MVQGRLFDAAPPLTRAERVARALWYVERRRGRAVCARCCGDERLVFAHRRAHMLNVPVWRLARAGLPVPALVDELRKCEVLCRRCFLGQRSDPPHIAAESSTARSA